VNADARERAGALLHRLQVAAGGERLSCPGQNGTAHVTILIDARAGVREQIAVAVFAQRIARIGAIDRQRDDVAILLK
jgi:hypothetical protein